MILWYCCIQDWKDDTTLPVVQYSHLVNDDHQPVTTYLEELGGDAANPLGPVLELAESLHN